MSDNTITYGKHTINVDALPAASVRAMLRRGVSHFLGSEQASKVTAYFDPESKAEGRLEDTPENREKVKADFQAKAIEALNAGTVGVSVRGPAADPIETIVRRLAKAEVTNILKANGVKFPAKADDTIEMPDGSKFTGAQLVDRRISGHGERLNQEAKKIAAEQAKKAAKALDAAKAEGLSGL